MLRIIAHYTLVTPVEAEGEFSYTIKNEGNAAINIVLFPRFSGFYFQRLEVFDSNGRTLEILKEDDPRCGKDLICVVLREPLKPNEQTTLRFRYALVPKRELKGRFIRKAVLTLVQNLEKGTSVYVHVLPPEGMKLELEDDGFAPFPGKESQPSETKRGEESQPSEIKGLPITTPEEGSRYISLRFPVSGGSPQPGAYLVRVCVQYPPSLSKTIILLPFITILLFSYVIVRCWLQSHWALPPLPSSIFLALFGALLGIRIWIFNELLMKRLSHLYVVSTVLSLMRAIFAAW